MLYFVFIAPDFSHAVHGPPASTTNYCCTACSRLLYILRVGVPQLFTDFILRLRCYRIILSHIVTKANSASAAVFCVTFETINDVIWFKAAFFALWYLNWGDCFLEVFVNRGWVHEMTVINVKTLNRPFYPNLLQTQFCKVLGRLTLG